MKQSLWPKILHNALGSPDSQNCCRHQHKPWWSSLCSPTIRCWSRYCGQQQAERPASAGRRSDLQLCTAVQKKDSQYNCVLKKIWVKKPSLDFMVLTDCFPMYASTAPNNLLYSVNAWYPYVRLTLGATPSTDKAGVVVRQNLVSRRQSGELDVVIESSIRCQTQEGNVIPERPAHSHFNE